MRFLTIISMTIVLSACTATPQKLRNSDPVFEMSSSSETSAFAICIAEKWENLEYLLYSPVVNVHQSSSGYEVTQYLDGVLTHLADIEKTQTGSTIKVYTESLNFGGDAAINSIASCK